MNLVRKSLDTNPSSPIATWGHLILRASIGAMIFYIHGLHKLEGGLAYLQHGTPWTLAKEVAEDGIRVNAIRAGYIYTDMHASGGEPGRMLGD